MGYKKIKGIKKNFSIIISRDAYLSKSGNVFAGDIKIKGKLTIEGNSRALEIDGDRTSLRTKAIE